jgi:hypothetical protein
MRVNDTLHYFGQPRTASEFMREKLCLHWNNDYHPTVWSECSLEYCHVNPTIYARHHGLPSPGPQMIALVRNPFDRLVSTWSYGTRYNLDYVGGRGFPDFVRYLYDTRGSPRDTQPTPWMHISTTEYFGDIIDHVQFFRLENINACLGWLHDKHGIAVENDAKLNSIDRGHYSSYFDRSSRWMAFHLYRDDLSRFGYAFQDSSLATRDPVRD